MLEHGRLHICQLPHVLAVAGLRFIPLLANGLCHGLKEKSLFKINGKYLWEDILLYLKME